MDALTLLQEVAAAYRNLQTLSIEASALMESGDEYTNSRNTRQLRFAYAHPNLLRFEALGKNGTTRISDGHQLHTVLPRTLHRQSNPQHSSTLLASADRPHTFRWDTPLSFGSAADPFLFPSIDQHVAAAEILRQEDACHVVSVTYEPSPREGFLLTKDLLFWINPTTHIVMRVQADIGHRIPTEDEISWSRHSISIEKIRINEPIPPETFEFTPPPNSKPLAKQGGRLGFAGGFGSGNTRIDRANPKQSFEQFHSAQFEGDSLIEVSRLKLRGKTLKFERRLTFSADGSELAVIEHITCPTEPRENRYTLKVS